jgi:FixJ family two-component response regulator
MSVRAMKEGAEFLTKPAPPRELIAGIRAAIERCRESHRAPLEAGALRARYERLTAREREVMGFVIAWLLSRQMAVSSRQPSGQSSSTVPTSCRRWKPTR